MKYALRSRLLGCCWLVCGSAAASAQTIETPKIVEIQPLQSLRVAPAGATVIPIPEASLFGYYSDLQVALGSAWVTRTNKNALRIDAESHEVVEVVRPRANFSGLFDLFVDERSLWHSTSMAAKGRIGGRGDVYRADPDTNELTATIPGVGVPFGSGGGAVWAYNRRSRVISAIDTDDNQLRAQFATEASLVSDQSHFAFGAGAIWQFAYEGDVSVWQMATRTYYGGTFPAGVVRRIDPTSGKVTAEITIGPYVPTTDIRVLAGDVWVMGLRDKDGLLRDGGGMAFATRIDATTNQVSAVIPFSIPGCNAPVLRSPVVWDGGIWVATGCSPDNGPPFGWGTGVKKIELETNTVTDELDWPAGRRIALLATGEGALWALFEGQLVRFEL